MRLSGWQVPIEHLSASSLSMLMTCPEQFRLRRIKKIPESRGLEKFIGTVDHETWAVNFKRKIDSSRDMSRESLHNVYQLSWDNEILDEGEPDWKDQDPTATHEHGLLMVDTYAQQVAPTVVPIRVEERWEQEIPDVPIKVIGYVDIEEKDRIVERKTSKTKLSKPKPAWELQARLYNMAYQKPVEWQIITRQVTPQIVLADTEPALRLDHTDHDSTVLIVQQAAEMLQNFWLKYGPDHPWPTQGILHPFMCGYCFAGPKYGNHCVAWKGKDDQVPNRVS
jgi:hypothetical protein